MATQATGAIILPPGFITREQAMRILQKSETSIERLVRTKEVESRLFPAAGRRPIRYYTEASVQAFKDLEERREAARPPSQLNWKAKSAPKEPPPQTSVELAIPDKAVSTLRELLERLIAPKPVPLTEKLWLSLDEASELSGLARGHLLTLINAGKLIALKSGGWWKIQRASLEAFAG